MKTLKTLSLACMLAILFSCGEDDPKKLGEYSLEDYLAKAGLTEITPILNSGSFEFGLRFKPKVNGSITEIHVTLPDNQTDLRVTIWDSGTMDDLRTETITTVTANVPISKTITPFVLEKDKEYMITFNSNDWYNHDSVDGDEISYPIKFGNITITGYGYIGGTAQAYPTSFPTDYYAGDLSFVFEEE
jgi:hypothetical protein